MASAPACEGSEQGGISQVSGDSKILKPWAGAHEASPFPNGLQQLMFPAGMAAIVFNATVTDKLPLPPTQVQKSNSN